MVTAITIDVEKDWGGRVEEYRGIQEGIPFLLDLFKELKIKATFFVSGEVVKQNKEMLLRIVAEGHEIGSHGFEHKDYQKVDLYKDISQSREIIEKELGVKPIGFRTPQFKARDELFEALGKIGFKYDSSMKNPKAPYKIKDILEMPVSTSFKLPMGLKWINATNFKLFPLKMYNVLYLHPFDLIEPGTRKDIPFMVRAWYNHKANCTKDTLRKILEYWSYSKNERFVRMEVLANEM